MILAIILPLLLGILQAAATFMVTYLKDDFIKQPWPVQVGIVAGFIFSLVTPTVACVNGVRAKQEKLRSDAYTVLLAAVTRISDKADIPAKDIGLNAYVVRWSFFLDRWPLRRFQSRIARIRLVSYPPPSTVVWRWGKGFVGECWQRESNAITRHIKRDYASYLGCSEDKWLGAPADVRLGLSYAEWQNTQQRYAFVSVVPIVTKRWFGRGHRYRGCVSLDTEDDAHAEKLAATDVREIIQNAADAIDVALQGKR